MLCKPYWIRTYNEIRRINFWDLLTGIPAGMCAFVAAALAGALIGEVQTASSIFLWMLALGSALMAILVGIVRGAHAAPSGLIQGLFTVGAGLFLWLKVYPQTAAILSILPILLVLLFLPVSVAVKVRDLRSN